MNDKKMNQNQNQMNRNYGVWPPPPLPDDHMTFRPGPGGPAGSGFAVPKPGRSNWKGKKGGDKRKKGLQAINSASNTGGGVGSSGGGGGGGYKPPTLHELQSQNRMKARRFYPKKKFNRFAPFAPRNTTSFIIRAKKSGGIASLVSPCPVTPAVLPTPRFSPSREVLVDMAKEEWGVDGYGSMNGLIRLRSPGQDDEEDEEGGGGGGGGGGGSSESDVEEHVEVERRLDHDLSRFEMIYPENSNAGFFGNGLDDQDTHIARLEEENLTLKERLYLMERELVDMRMRLQCLEDESRAKKAKNGGQMLDNEEIEGSGDKEDEKEEININEVLGVGKNTGQMLDNEEIEEEMNKNEVVRVEIGAVNDNDDEMLENETEQDNKKNETLETETEAGGAKEENNNVAVLENVVESCRDKEENNNDELSDVCSEKSVGKDD